MDPDDAPTPDHRHGSDDLYWVDLRSLLPHAEKVKVAHPLMCARLLRPKEERQNRCRQDCRLLAMRFPARVPHGIDPDPGRYRTLRYRSLLIRQMVGVKTGNTSLKENHILDLRVSRELVDRTQQVTYW